MTALDAVGNPVRRQILRLLRDEPRSVGELSRELPRISRPAVSRHLRVLGEARLVSHTPAGTRNVYALDPAGFEDLRAFFEDFWDAVLPRYALVAENLADDDDDDDDDDDEDIS